MFNFKAYFYGNDVNINEKYRYDSNEILTVYLKNSRAKKIFKEDFVDRLKSFKRRPTLSPYMEYENFLSSKSISRKYAWFTVLLILSNQDTFFCKKLRQQDHQSHRQPSTLA